MPPLSNALPLRDFELDCILLGPATRMLLVEADPQGGVFYQFGRREPRLIQLPPGCGALRFGLIDMPQVALLLDPGRNRLLAVATFTAQGNQLILMGSLWGHWLDEEGETRRSQNIPGLLRRLKASIAIDDVLHTFSFNFMMNQFGREGFAREAVAVTTAATIQRHEMYLRFTYPGGEFAQAQVEVRDPSNDHTRGMYDLRGFPLVWPPLSEMVIAGASGDIAAEPRGGVEDPLDAALRRKRERTFSGSQTDSHDGRSNSRGSSTASGTNPEDSPAYGPAGGGNHRNAPRPAAPVLRTEHLPLEQLMDLLGSEPDDDRRWRMIEANLQQGRPERVYALIARYAEEIAVRTPAWPPVRLKSAFALQPGAVLTHVMHAWSNNQVLAVAEDNAESSKIIQWLGEREVERLLALKSTEDPITATQARALLRVDKHADATAVKRVWRTLLASLNADHGRANERAIHRKKDEIAKQLQVARNLLMK